MNAREMLELAAKAAEIKGDYYSGVLNDEWVDGVIYIREDGQQCIWSPLTDDGDALRLAVKLGLTIYCGKYHVSIEFNNKLREETVTMGHTIEDATRRAIVRAAAEIGKGMK